MKNIEVTYDALICENDNYEQGEAAFVLPMTDELAAEYLAGRATDRGAVNLVETALEAVEVIFPKYHLAVHVHIFIADFEQRSKKNIIGT